MMLRLQGTVAAGKTTAAAMMIVGAQALGKSVAVADCEGGLIAKIGLDDKGVTYIEPVPKDILACVLENVFDVLIIDGFDHFPDGDTFFQTLKETMQKYPRMLVVTTHQERPTVDISGGDDPVPDEASEVEVETRLVGALEKVYLTRRLVEVLERGALAGVIRWREQFQPPDGVAAYYIAEYVDEEPMTLTLELQPSGDWGLTVNGEHFVYLKPEQAQQIVKIQDRYAVKHWQNRIGDLTASLETLVAAIGS